MQSTVDALQHRLPDATVTGGDPAQCIYLQCAQGTIDLRWYDSRVLCLLPEVNISAEIAGDGLSVCLNSNARSDEPFRPCSGFQEAADALLASAGWWNAHTPSEE
jgi:hypothetical protein